jgi:25S rRNA (adenine2142-N1)-methyltransferase
MLANNKAPRKRLAPLPFSKSRKRARKVTTLFHRYTQLKEAASTPDEQHRLQELIEEIGGQPAYQKASQVSTSYHSTSKWVLGCLAQNGWLYGISDEKGHHPDTDTMDETNQVMGSNASPVGYDSLRHRRETRLLEIGAINTELLDAAAAIDRSQEYKNSETTNEQQRQQSIVQKKYRLCVRAIDLHAMHDGIEEVDFLSLPLLNGEYDLQHYDVVVCSMVLNCVPTAEKRGAMLLRIVNYLRDGGLAFITVPKTCLNLSPYIDEQRFAQMLRDIGFDIIEHTKDTPKIAFFICQKRAQSQQTSKSEVKSKWHEVNRFRHGKKFRNKFAICLPQQGLNTVN